MAHPWALAVGVNVNRVHRFFSFSRMVRHLWGGATLTRAFFHEAIRGLRLKGPVLDLGSKSSDASYYAYISVEPPNDIVFTDLEPTSPEIVALDVERDFPFEDSTFDTVIAFHLLEHVFHFRRAIPEIQRVLRVGGTAIVSVPFMHPYHEDPMDYFRFTDAALERLFAEAGLECVRVESLGEGVFTMALTRMMRFSRPRRLSSLLQCLAYVIGSPVDRLVDRLQRQRKGAGVKTVAEIHAVEHIGIFVKGPSLDPLTATGSN